MYLFICNVTRKSKLYAIRENFVFYFCNLGKIAKVLQSRVNIKANIFNNATDLHRFWKYGKLKKILF